MEKNELYFYKEVVATYKGKEFIRRQTIAGIIENGKLRIGVAECSEKDRFDKSKGRKIALGRAKSQKARVEDLADNTKPVSQFIELVK